MTKFNTLLKSSISSTHNRINTILLLFISIFIFSCNNAEKPNEIDFWHFCSEPEQKIVLDKIIKNFENETGIKVNQTELSWNDGKIKLIAAFNSRTQPDLIELGSDWIAQFSSSGVLMQIEDSLLKDKYLDFSLEPSTWQSKFYAIPWYVDTRAIFINKKIFKEEGISSNFKNFTQLLDAACIIEQRGNYRAYAANGPDAHRLYKKALSFVWSCGGNLIDKNGLPSFDSKEVIEALKIYKRTVDCGVVEKQKNLDNLFLQGKVAILPSGSWLLDKLSSTKIDYEILDLRYFDEQNKYYAFAGGEYLAVTKRSQKQEKALKLAQYISNGKNALYFCSNVNSAGYPADKKYFNHPSLVANPSKMQIAKQLPFSKMTPVHPKWLELETIFEEAVEKVIFGIATAELALIDAQKKAEKVIAED